MKVITKRIGSLRQALARRPGQTCPHKPARRAGFREPRPFNEGHTSIPATSHGRFAGPGIHVALVGVQLPTPACPVRWGNAGLLMRIFDNPRELVAVSFQINQFAI